MGKKEILERSVKGINSYGNGRGVLITREARAIGLISSDRVQVTAIRKGSKKYIIIEKFPPKE